MKPFFNVTTSNLCQLACLMHQLQALLTLPFLHVSLLVHTETFCLYHLQWQYKNFILTVLIFSLCSTTPVVLTVLFVLLRYHTRIYNIVHINKMLNVILIFLSLSYLYALEVWSCYSTQLSTSPPVTSANQHETHINSRLSLFSKPSHVSCSHRDILLISFVSAIQNI